MLRNNAGPFLFHRLDRRFRERLYLDKPLGREEGLDGAATTIAVAERHGVVTLFHQLPFLAQVLKNGFSSLEAVKTLIGRGPFRHHPVLVDDFHYLKPVPSSNLEIGGVMSGSDFQRPCPEIRIDSIVGDDRHLTKRCDRQQNLPADHLLESLVCRIDGDGDVAGNRFRTCRGDNDSAFLANEWVQYVEKTPLLVVVFHFEIGEGSVTAGTPVNDLLVTIDEPVVKEADEYLPDRL